MHVMWKSLSVKLTCMTECKLHIMPGNDKFCDRNEKILTMLMGRRGYNLPIAVTFVS